MLWQLIITLKRWLQICIDSISGEAMLTKSPRTSRNTLTVPGPRPMPILGSIGNLLQLTFDPLNYMERLFKNYGPIAALVGSGRSRVFSTQPDCPGTVFVYGPELSREVEVQHDVYHKSPLSGTLYPTDNPPRQQPLLEYVTGLFSVNGDEHRRHRRLLAPAFHKKRIEAYCADMINLIQKTLGNWKIGECHNTHAEMMHLTQRIATKTLFGTDIGEGRSIGAALQESLKIVRSSWTILFPYDLPGLPYRHFLDVVKQINVGIRDIVAHKRAQGIYGSDVLSMLVIDLTAQYFSLACLFSLPSGCDSYAAAKT
jgi:cytochrome P450